MQETRAQDREVERACCAWARDRDGARRASYGGGRGFRGGLGGEEKGSERGVEGLGEHGRALGTTREDGVGSSGMANGTDARQQCETDGIYNATSRLRAAKALHLPTGPTRRFFATGSVGRDDPTLMNEFRESYLGPVSSCVHVIP